MDNDFMNKMNLLDQACLGFDQILKSLTQLNQTTGRPDPGENLRNEPLSAKQSRVAAGLMRINHTGEVCAQALYLGQGLTAKLAQVRQKMRQAAAEEVDHLAWCKHRLDGLGSHTSYLNPLWFMGSFAIGATAGLIGDKWSLGFVAETERQVVKHLEEHQLKLPKQDLKSHAVIEQMRIDEEKHRQMAIDAGAATFPKWVRLTMKVMSKVMTTTTYWV